MISAVQIRAARMMLGLDQQMLADLAGLSVPTIQRMEASDGVVRGNVASLTRLITALESAGIEFISAGAASPGGGCGSGPRRKRLQRTKARPASGPWRTRSRC